MKRAENIFVALKKMADKSRFGPKRSQHGRIVNPRVSNKTIILRGLAVYKMVLTKSALRAPFKTIAFTYLEQSA